MTKEQRGEWHVKDHIPEWKDGNAPYMWVPNIGKDGTPCACRNGSQPCESAQTCLWFAPTFLYPWPSPLLPGGP